MKKEVIKEVINHTFCYIPYNLQYIITNHASYKLLHDTTERKGAKGYDKGSFTVHLRY